MFNIKIYDPFTCGLCICTRYEFQIEAYIIGYDYPTASLPFVEKNIFSPLYYFVLLLKLLNCTYQISFEFSIVFH